MLLQVAGNQRDAVVDCFGPLMPGKWDIFFCLRVGLGER